MSSKKSPIAIGLTALGLFGVAATHAAYPVEAPAPPGQTAAPASASNPTHTVLLMTNGRLLSGTITREGKKYLVQSRAGTIPVPADQVEETFESIAAVYRYKVAQVPERDPDEHLKLARWCLGQNMTAEAMTELKAVLAVSPRAREAKAMLANLEMNAERNRAPRSDPALMRTSGEAAMSAAIPGEARPSEIDALTVRRAVRDLNISQTPVIFDLPPTVAAKRGDQFARDIHPLLQASCARCHDEQHPGAFQLVAVRSRKGLSGDILRANLDATLRLIDPENPSRSEILSSALVPHGKSPNPRPIFRGSNDPRYQILSAWVKSLQLKPPVNDQVLPTRFAPENAPAPSSTGGFAVDRVAGQGARPGVTTTPLVNQARAPQIDRKELPPLRAVPGQGMVAETSAPPPGEFPVPPMLGGPLPTPRPGNAAAPPKSTGSASAPLNPPLPPPIVAASPAGSSTEDDELPDPVPPPVAKPRKPVKLDPELLEKAILNRNGGR